MSELMNPCCNFTCEDSNPTFLRDTQTPDGAPSQYPYQVWLPKVKQFKDAPAKSHTRIQMVEQFKKYQYKAQTHSLYTPLTFVTWKGITSFTKWYITVNKILVE